MLLCKSVGTVLVLPTRDAIRLESVQEETNGEWQCDEHGSLTEAGRTGRAAIEVATDELDDCLWSWAREDQLALIEAAITPLLMNFPPDDQLDWSEVYD